MWITVRMFRKFMMLMYFLSLLFHLSVAFQVPTFPSIAYDEGSLKFSSLDVSKWIRTVESKTIHLPKEALMNSFNTTKGSLKGSRTSYHTCIFVDKPNDVTHFEVWRIELSIDIVEDKFEYQIVHGFSDVGPAAQGMDTLKKIREDVDNTAAALTSIKQCKESQQISQSKCTSIEFDIYSWGYDTPQDPIRGKNGSVWWQDYKNNKKQNRCDAPGIGVGVLVMDNANPQQTECRKCIGWNADKTRVQTKSLEKYLMSLKGKNKIVVIMVSDTATLEGDYDDWNRISKNFLRPLGCNSVPRFREPFIFVGYSDRTQEWTDCQTKERFGGESISKKIVVPLIYFFNDKDWDTFKYIDQSLTDETLQMPNDQLDNQGTVFFESQQILRDGKQSAT